MRALLLASIFVAVACGGTTTNNGGDAGSDASTKPDTSSGSDGGNPIIDAGAFCTGDTSRIMINGTEQPVVSATGRQLVLNCCDSAELTVATTAYQAYLNVLWRSPAGGGTSPIDLANPPTGFQIELDLGCDPATTACATASPEERYADGFQGTLTYTYDTAGLKTGYCLTVSELPQTPHTIIHTLTLYTPAILCAY